MRAIVQKAIRTRGVGRRNARSYVFVGGLSASPRRSGSYPPAASGLLGPARSAVCVRTGPALQHRRNTLRRSPGFKVADHSPVLVRGGPLGCESHALLRKRAARTCADPAGQIWPIWRNLRPLSAEPSFSTQSTHRGRSLNFGIVPGAAVSGLSDQDAIRLPELLLGERFGIEAEQTEKGGLGLFR
jgi:hypothetical protein